MTTHKAGTKKFTAMMSVAAVKRLQQAIRKAETEEFLTDMPITAEVRESYIVDKISEEIDELNNYVAAEVVRGDIAVEIEREDYESYDDDEDETGLKRQYRLVDRAALMAMEVE